MNLETRIRDHVRERADELPGVSVALGDVLARGRRRRRVRIAFAAAIVAVIVVVAGVGVAARFDGSDPVVLAAPESIAQIVAASWTPVPSPAAPGLREAAEQLCPADQHPHYDGTLPLIIVDQRGDGAVAYFAATNDQGSYSLLCNLARLDGQWVHGVDVDTAMGGGALTGNTHNGVVEVLFEQPDGATIQASVGGGHYLFWWPQAAPQDGTVIQLDADGNTISRDPLRSPGEAPPTQP